MVAPMSVPLALVLEPEAFAGPLCLVDWATLCCDMVLPGQRKQALRQMQWLSLYAYGCLHAYEVPHTR